MHNLTTTEYHGIRVLTSAQVAEMYGTDTKTISYNFSYNKKKYTEGKHYIKLEGNELREFKANREIPDCHKFSAHLYLWTEKGALLIAKSLNTEKAWAAYEYLVDFYFRAKEENLPEKKEVVPVQTTTEPVKKKTAIPAMDEPVFVFKNLLALAEEQGIALKLKDLKGYDSYLKGQRIAIRKNQMFEKVVYEAAFELAHYFIHYNEGDMINSPLAKDYNDQAEKAAFMIIRLLDIKAKQKY